MNDVPPPMPKERKVMLPKMRLKMQQMARRKKMIGFGVLLIGVLAFAGVGWFAYSHYFSEEAQIETAQKKRQKAIQKRIRSGKVSRLSVAPKKLQKSVNQNLLTLKSQSRQPKISFGAMSQGSFSKRGDILHFVPDRTIQPPKTIKGEPINSRKLTASPFPVMVAQHGENIIWTRPTREASRAARVFTPNEHTIFSKVEEKIVVWKRMK